MALYTYKGISAQGRDVKRTIKADSLASAKQRIQSEGVTILSISEKKTGSSGNFKATGKVKIDDLGLMTRQLATLVKAKIPLAEALSALVDQVENEQLRIILAEVRQKINEGSSLAKGLSAYPKVFNNIFINMVEAGEASGTLDVVLIRLAEFTEAQIKLKNKISSSMMYPLVMISVMFLAMILIFVGIIPKIAKLLKAAKKELPLPTQICIHISQFLQDYWYLVIMAIPVIVYLVKRYLNSNSGKIKWHTLQLKLPIVGKLVTMINIGRFCSTLSTLLNSGVPILVAMNIVKNLISNVHLQKAVIDARFSVSEGGSLAFPLVESGLFPPMVTHMIRLGEKSGELEPLLEIVAESYEDQVEAKLNALTSIIEPVMMVFMGFVVAFVVFAVVMPLMEMNSMQ